MNLTRFIILAVIAIVVGIDVWLVISRGSDATISWQLYTWAQHWPIIPFLLGGVFGHIFAPQPAEPLNG